MFISKWRYEKNLENARKEGYREGVKEVDKQKISYLQYLELKEENWALKDRLTAALEKREADATELAAKMAEDAAQQMNKSLVNNLAEGLAQYQKMADVAYYVNGSQEESSRMLDWAFVIKELASRMGICADVFARAYEIYDFRNSGKKGYTLKDGKIVKIEQEEPAVACPFAEDQAAESCEEDCSGEEIPVCCPEVSDITDSRENCCAVQESAGEEDFF